VDGEWFFSRRRERHWYAADVTRPPQSVGFAGWTGSATPALPAEFGSWAPFWEGDARAGALTRLLTGTTEATWATEPAGTTGRAGSTPVSANTAGAPPGTTREAESTAEPVSAAATPDRVPR
jgi:hypothetical protein